MEATDATRLRLVDHIQIRGVRVFGHHGVYDRERRDGQHFVVDLDLDVDLSRAASTDALEDTVHYGLLAERVADAVAGTRFNLIEALAGHLADLALEAAIVQAVTVRVAKPEAPMDVDLDEVAVVLRRVRPVAQP